MHWAATVQRLGEPVPVLDPSETWVFGGHFYGSHSPAPTEDEAAAALSEGSAAGATTFLVPAVRSAADVGPLVRRGFAPIPWFIESVYERRLGYDTDLRAQIGGDWYRGVLAVVRKAERFYDIAYYTADHVRADPSILEVVARLHACNVTKYGHALNFYSASILDRILRSPLADKLLLCVRRDRETGEAVQTYISLVIAPGPRLPAGPGDRQRSCPPRSEPVHRSRLPAPAVCRRSRDSDGELRPRRPGPETSARREPVLPSSATGSTTPTATCPTRSAAWRPAPVACSRSMPTGGARSDPSRSRPHEDPRAPESAFSVHRVRPGHRPRRTRGRVPRDRGRPRHRARRPPVHPD